MRAIPVIIRTLLVTLCLACGVVQIPQTAFAQSPPLQVIKTGSGFFVSARGHIVTNNHVVSGCDAVRSSAGGVLQKVATDRESDLALYLTPEKPLAVARIHGGRGARPGEPIVVVGFPLHGLLGQDPIVTTGTISALSGINNDRRRIQITAPIQPGNSGGPLLGENGGVVGVVVAKLDELNFARFTGELPQNVNFAVSLGTLLSFLDANGVPYQLADNPKPKAPADIAAEAKGYTVLLECIGRRTEPAATAARSEGAPRARSEGAPQGAVQSPAPAAKAAPAAPAPAVAAATPTGVVFPKAVSATYASEAPGRARMLSCRDQYEANKTTGANGGLEWSQKGGGYYSACNDHLKGAGN